MLENRRTETSEWTEVVAICGVAAIHFGVSGADLPRKDRRFGRDRRRESMRIAVPRMFEKGVRQADSAETMGGNRVRKG
jgi:hypothetical protein